MQFKREKSEKGTNFVGVNFTKREGEKINLTYKNKL